MTKLDNMQIKLLLKIIFNLLYNIINYQTLG